MENYKRNSARVATAAKQRTQEPQIDWGWVIMITALVMGYTAVLIQYGHLVPGFIKFMFGME